MKKILISLMAIALVIGLVGAGAFAYFSDTETSTDNTFTAGTLNLKVNTNDGSNTVVFTESNKAPGDSGSGTWTLVNNGSLAGYVDLESISVANAENYDAATNEAEAADDVNTSIDGELGANLDVVLFWDDGAGGGIADNRIQDGTEATIYSGVLDSIAGSYGADYPLAASGTTYISMTWSIATTVDNAIQGDSATLDMTVELAQTAGQ